MFIDVYDVCLYYVNHACLCMQEQPRQTLYKLFMSTSHISHSLFLICVCVRVLCLRDTCSDLQSACSVCVCVCACSVCAPLFCLAALWSSFAFGVIEKPTKNTKTSHVVTRTRTHTHTQMYKHAHAHARTGSCRAAAHPRRGNSDGSSSSSWKRKLLLQESSAARERERAEQELKRVALLRALSKWESALSIECKCAKRWKWIENLWQAQYKKKCMRKSKRSSSRRRTRSSWRWS